MCGIAGVVDLSGRAPLPERVLQKMAGVLFHRGPDEEGYLERPGLGFAARRLSILNLQGGHQPVANENETIWAVFNGELFDWPSLRANLQARGHVLRTHCDSELIPHLWEEYHEEMFSYLRGQFAFALWDQRAQRLILARDRFGICPLFWTRLQASNGAWLLFASEIKAVLASGLVECRPDPRGLNQVFTLVSVPGPTTCFERIEALQPGHYLSVNFDTLARPAPVHDRTYWQIEFPDERGHCPEAEPRQLTEQFETVLYRAVERRLRADVPVVSYLSGGVDSSLIAAMACKVLGTSIPTFTVAVDDQTLNESKAAATVRSHLASQGVVVPYTARHMLQLYPKLIHCAEAPVIDTSAAANLLLAGTLHDHGFKVALTGEGADEWLAGYPWFRGVHFLHGLRRLHLGWLTSPAIRAHLRWLGAPAGTDAFVRQAEQAIGGHNVWLIWTTLMGISRSLFFSRELKRRLADHSPWADLQLNVVRMRRWHPLHRGLCAGARTLLAGMLLSAKGDRVAMQSSVENRYPFLDEDVFAFLATLHPRWKLRGLMEKYLLRLVAERWLPRSIAWRRKAMFRAPLDPFHSPSRPAFVDQLLSSHALRKSGYFDVDAVRRWRASYRRLQSGSLRRVAVEMGLVGVVATQLWHHLFIDPTLADLNLPAFHAMGRPETF